MILTLKLAREIRKGFFKGRFLKIYIKFLCFQLFLSLLSSFEVIFFSNI
jgi:hypothetical protein